MFSKMLKQQVLKKAVSVLLSLALALTLFNMNPVTTVHAAPEDNLGILDIHVNKPVHAVVDLHNATIEVSLPYGTIYQMLNVTTNGANAVLYRSDETTMIPFATSGLNKGDAKMDQFSPNGTTTYYLVVTDSQNSSNSKKYTITVTVNSAVPPLAGNMGPTDTYSPLNIQAGESAWDVMGASKIGNGSGTGSIEGPGVPSSYSGKPWAESVYDRSGDYPVASTVNETWLGDNMYLQTIGRNDVNALTKYGIANVPGTSKLNSDILRFHEFKPFVTPTGVSRDDGDRGAVDSDRQRLEIKSNTSAANINANSVGGDIMTHHWRLMLPSETLRFQQDVGENKAGDFINPHRFFHIFQLKEIAGNAAGQPVTTLTLVSSEGKGQLEFRNNPDGSAADRIKPLFSIPFDQIADRWLDMEVTILTADKGYLYGKLVDLESGDVLFEGGMTAETYRRPEVTNPSTGRLERGDLPVEAGQQNRSKWGLYRGMYNGEGDTAYADEWQSATMYLSDVHLIKRDKNSYIFPNGWNPRAQLKDAVAWARPAAVSAAEGTAFGSLTLPSQLDVTLSTGATESVNVTWSSNGYHPDQTGIQKIYGEFNSPGITNTAQIQPYVEVNLSSYKNWAVTPGASIKVVSSSGNSKGNFIDDNATTAWQANSSLTKTDGYQYWAAVKLEHKIDVSKIQIEWTSNSKFLKNYQVYYANDAAAYDELKEGNALSATSDATRKPLETANGSLWQPIPDVGKTTALENNEKASHTLAVPVAAQYILLVSDVTLDNSAGGIKANVFNVYGEPSVTEVPVIPTSSVNLLDSSRFTPQAGVNFKVSSEATDHPGIDALRSGGSGYWQNANSTVYKGDYSPSSLALTLDLGAPKVIDKLYLEIPNTIANIQSNATRFEVYYTNNPASWASAPTASDGAQQYDWKANGWTLAGGTETEGLWSYMTYNGQQWGYDTKTFLYPFTARYVMVNTVLVGPRDRRANEANSMMGLSGLKIYGKDVVTNATALVPAKDTYSTWDQVAPISTTMNLGGKVLTSITKGDHTLLLNTDYMLSGNTITFTPSYLAKLPLGTNEWWFHFNSGASSLFAVDVIARGYGGNDKTIKMNAIEGVSPYNVLGGAMGTDEPVEGITKRIRDGYHEFYGNQPQATAADDHIKSVWDSTLQKNVFKITANGRGLNNEFLDKVRDGEYGHKGVFDKTLGYVVDGAAVTDRQRIEIRPSEDSNRDFVAYEGDVVSYSWMWNIPDGTQWNQSNFRHIFQLKATNRQLADTLPGGNNGGENGAYILAMSISGTTNRNLVVNHNRYDGDKNLMTIPLREIDGHWIKVELNAHISDSGWLTIKITDQVTGKVYTFDSPDVYQVFGNQGTGDGVKDLWRRPERAGGFETEYPAAFDQYLRPKWGIYRSSANGTNSAYDAELGLSDITISKVASGVSSVNLALNKKAYNVGPTVGANPIQLQSAAANGYGNADKLTNGVLQDPTKWTVTNVTNLEQIGNYSWLGTDGERKGSFVIDLGQAMDFSQIRLFAKSTRLKGATVSVSPDFGDHSSAADFNNMVFQQVEKQTALGYTYETGNKDSGADSADSSYPINLGKTYHARYMKVMVENASGGNAGTDLTGPPRLTQVQVFNAPLPPQHLTLEASESGNLLKWDANVLSEGYTVYNETTVLANLPGGLTSYMLPSGITDLSKVTVRSKGTDPYSRKFMISAPTSLHMSTDIIGIAPLSITTNVGIAPVLPTVVTAVYSDNSTGQRAVVWDPILASQYAAVGSFNVQGSVTGVTYKALATITVTAVDIPLPVIVNYSPITITTTAGTAPVLPTVVTAVYSDNSTRQLGVVWNNIEATQYASAGTFKVQGTVEGASLKAEATITVTARTTDSGSDSGSGSGTGSSTGSSSGTTGIIDLDKDAKVTKETTADGKSVTKVTLDADKLEKALAIPVVVIEVKGSEPIVNVVLPAQSILNAIKKQADAVIQIKANSAVYELPVQLFKDIAKDSTISIVISKVLGKAGDDVNAAVNRLNAKQVVANPIDFTITINGKELSDFGGVYVNRTISLGTWIGDPSKVTAVWIDANNGIHFVPALITTNNGSSEATIRSPHNSIYTVIQSNQSFADLAGHWAKADVELLANKWIVNGITDKLFAPEAQVTRAEFAAMLVRSLGLAEKKSNAFRDVQPGDWFAGAVSTAYLAGLINGYEDGTFKPIANITREQMVAMMMRAMKVGGKEIQAGNSVIDRFADRSIIGDWSKTAVAQALTAGLIQGMTDKVFAPTEPATRAQAATMLKRMLQSLQFIN
ncbi:Ig-like domain-containing protein [Paenibacillus qinlingensis]|uniref:F5/8 type C domain-containing protein n=1 Tax=Paenibacillus qinlingensis TaxID=1837343 RepID=A0ABU1P045_9BACL|nr:Ig-like domain-containing protein [Paenibacillus qinlingensis]MDR6553100.1 hypothetical protein [Paenibacillus qinlingensis]